MCCERFVSNLLCIFKVSFVNNKFHKSKWETNQWSDYDDDDDDDNDDDEKTTTSTQDK